MREKIPAMRDRRVRRRQADFWLLQAPGWMLLFYLVVAQGVPAFNYDIGVAMGVQEPAERITEIGVAFFKGFAIGDVLTYIPLLAAGLIGHYKCRMWGRMILASALGITVYWPIVSLAAVASARGAAGWQLEGEAAYWIVLPLIALWAAWGLWRLARE